MKKLYISMYHYTRDLAHSRYPEIKGLDKRLFREQLEFFGKNFNVVTMEHVMEAANGGDLPDNALLLTFDDGYIDNFTVAMPLLEEYGMQGSFFIPGKSFTEHKLLDVNKIHFILASAEADKVASRLKERMDHYRGLEYDYAETDELYNTYVEGSRYDAGDTVFVKQMLQTALPEKVRNIISSELFNEFVCITEETLAYELYMTEEQIRTLKRHGMFIGLHGYDHYWLGETDEISMKRDVDKALDAMSGFIDSNCWVMNYPYGSYSEGLLEYISAKGCKLGLTTDVRIADLSVDNPLLLPRFDCNDFPPKGEGYREIE